MRVELENGDWVDLSERLNYAQATRIRAADKDIGVFVATLVLRWALRDVDGEPIECPTPDVDGIPVDAMRRIPFDVFAVIAEKAASELADEPAPKGSAGRSPGSPSARRSRSPRSSPTPTSSPTTRDGPGTISDLRRPA